MVYEAAAHHYNAAMAKRDYYELLGISRSATKKQIKSAYRKLARKYHPDVNKSPDAADNFKEATEAYEVLSDANKRPLYDQFGHAGMTGQGYAGPGAGAYGRSPGGFGVNINDIFSGRSTGFMGMSLDDILNALRGRPARSRRPRAAEVRGRDLEYEITLDFLQAINGATTTVRIAQDGRGKSAPTETIAVKIPPGVRDGQRIRLRGKGEAGRGGSGDLYIITRIGKHPYFRREGNDIYVDLPISITEAALGTKVDLPTIDGMTTVTIPPGTSSARKLRLKGKGTVGPRGGARGDQYVVIKIVAPQKLSGRHKELLEELQGIDKGDPRAGLPWK